MDIINYALGIGYNSENEAVCLILSVDSIETGSDIALKAESAHSLGNDLYLNSENDVLVLKNISDQCVTMVNNKMPVVVLDPKNNEERLVPIR